MTDKIVNLIKNRKEKTPVMREGVKALRMIKSKIRKELQK